MNSEKYNLALQRAARDFKDLVIYICVTRLKHNKHFFANGKFDANVAARTIANAGRNKDNSRIVNYALGINKDLVHKVLGYYKDDNGRKTRIKIDDVLTYVNDKKTVVIEVNAGAYTTKKEVRVHWTKKYMLADIKYWHMLLDNDKYDDIHKYGTKSLQKKVMNWYSKFEVQKQKTTVPAKKEQPKQKTTVTGTNEQPKQANNNLSAIYSFIENKVKNNEWPVYDGTNELCILLKKPLFMPNCYTKNGDDDYLARKEVEKLLFNIKRRMMK